MSRTQCIGVALICSIVALGAGGILPDRDNLVIIEGEFSPPSPSFLLVFSAKPWQTGGQLVESVSVSEIANLRVPDAVVIRVHGKQANAAGRIEYAFGTKRDADRSWNNGAGFRWQDWEKYSPDVWDNLAIVAAPDSAAQKLLIRNVTVRKGGHLLFNSRASASYPNKRRIDAGIPAMNLAPANGRAPVLNLAGAMARFRRDYYELGNSPLLLTAYSDLGQTDKRKYANRGANWCSEFATFVYRSRGMATPDPNRSDVNWRNMREYFQNNGHVYPAREVAAWPDQKKLALIKPGSFVSILIGENTHSILFTTWVKEAGKPITRYVGVSGNNRGMVWSHAPLKLPNPDDLRGRTAEQLRDYDQKVYFGVPR